MSVNHGVILLHDPSGPTSILGYMSKRKYNLGRIKSLGIVAIERGTILIKVNPGIQMGYSRAFTKATPLNVIELDHSFNAHILLVARL